MYVDRQAEVSATFRRPAEWRRKAILNVARTGWFSSDRTIHEYATQIWGLRPLHIKVPSGNGAGGTLLT